MYLNQLFYAADENLWNTFRLGVTFTERINADALTKALSAAAKRFPCFSVKLSRSKDVLKLRNNDAPFTVSSGGRTVALGTDESGYHLLAFAYEGNTLYMDASHFITDGQGSFLFLKTIIYFYLSTLHPHECFDTTDIPISEDALGTWNGNDAPYPDEVLPESPLGVNRIPDRIFRLEDQPMGYESMNEWTSFRYHISEKSMISHISSLDGSPTTFFAALMYKAICELYPDNQLPLVCGVQHSFRRALKKAFSHHCHVSIVPLVYPERLRSRDIERINTISRGIIMLRAHDDNDALTVNEHIRREQRIKGMSFSQKHQYMKDAVMGGIGSNTFEISYTGRVPWGGLDRYITDVSPYFDMTLSGGISMEIFSVSDTFCVNIMQRNAEEKYVRVFSELLTQSGVPYEELPPTHFEICPFRLPEREE